MGRRRRGAVVPVLMLSLLAIGWWSGSKAEIGPRETTPSATLWSSDDWVPGEILVDVLDEADGATLASVARDHGLPPLEPISAMSASDHLMKVRVPLHDVDRVLASLRLDPRVEAADPNATLYAFGIPNDPRFKEQWNIQRIRAPEAWDQATGAGVVVAVIDTGVAYEANGSFFCVEDLAGTKFTKGFDFLSGQPHGNDDHGHGTHVAGTIAQATNNGIGVTGVAHGATIMPLKVLSARGSGSVGHIAQAIRYAADNGAKVINMSLGGPFPTKVLEDACTYAKSKGVLVVCAAGNEKKDKVGYPAGFAACVAVSATDVNDELAWYSNWGDKVALAAPGGDTRNGEAGGILQNCIDPRQPSKQGYFAFQGTSMACPHVAGAAALVMSAGVTCPDKVLSILQSTARPKEDKRRFGAGIIDCAAAVKKAKTSHGWGRLMAAVLMALAVLRQVNRTSIRGVGPSPTFILGLLIGACGLFFIPDQTAGRIPLSTFLTSGVPQWDIPLLGADHHMDPVFYSVAVPLILAVVFFGVTRWRRLLAGFAAGVGAHLGYALVVPLGDVKLASSLAPLWLLINCALCAFLSTVLLRSTADESKG